MKNILVRFLLLLSLSTLSRSLPLSTRSRWIVDDATGARVKLACVNWVGHLEPLLPEGLDHKPVASIAKSISDLGFNCVRLTWPIYMYTRHADLRVAESFSNLGLFNALEGIARHNPGFLNLTVVDAQRAVIDALAEAGVMVELDNHLSKPMWCCNKTDGNGFFGDKYFDPKEWLHGLHIVAKRYRNTPMVVAMSLRNELRGPSENETVWYRYVTRGVETIHRANPKLLIMVSGLNFDLNLNFLREKPLKLDFKNKVVYEVHRYSFSASGAGFWVNQTYGKACRGVAAENYKEGAFLLDGPNAAPLYVSEFGINQQNVSRADALYFSCYLSYLAVLDLDWSLWAFQGSYYLRQGLQGPGETFGLMNTDWTALRNPGFYRRLRLIQRKFRDPFSANPNYHVVYHPTSGRCIGVNNSEVHAGECQGFSRWRHEGNGKPLRLSGTGLCLSANGDDMPVTLTANCEIQQSRWEVVSGELRSKDEHGNNLCLQLGDNSSSGVTTKKCSDIAHTQWLQLIEGNA